MEAMSVSAERQRLTEDRTRHANWKRWGPYLADRQWATVREDYSPAGSCWDYFPHDHARSRAYRWGEDGLLGITDRQCRLCFAFALWNGRDAMLKERLFGLTNPEGNHGEDVKECYWFLEAAPTASYLKALYKYPQAAFPYEALREVNARRGVGEPEYELEETGVFDEGRYFDVVFEYAKAGPNEILIRLTATNRGPTSAALTILPQLWFRNTWSWGRTGEGFEGEKPVITRAGPRSFRAVHATLGGFVLTIDGEGDESSERALFTDNDTNMERLFDAPNASPYVKDAFHRAVVEGAWEAVNPAETGTKAAFLRHCEVPAGGSMSLRLHLCSEHELAVRAHATPPRDDLFDSTFETIMVQRKQESADYLAEIFPEKLDAEAKEIVRQAYAGLIWTKQAYHYVVPDWLEGDPAQPAPPSGRNAGRNADWGHLFNRDVLSMPDGWEYPWYAAWDLAFHMLPFARLDPDFAKEQLLLLLREWYMHPNGQIPAYEFNFNDVNPPVHAWAVWRVYKKTGPKGQRDSDFLARAFHKLLINFTWWVNRKDIGGRHIFAGGFLGLDNIGVFDRSAPLPAGHSLEQADGTAWMAFYCGTMLSMALELATEDPAYDDVASKFFEHFVAIADAMNTLGGSGLWNEEDGFYYDQLHVNGDTLPLKVRSLVGLIPLIAVEVLEAEVINRLPGFARRTRWFLRNRADLARHISWLEADHDPSLPPDHEAHLLLAIPSRDRLERVLRRLLDTEEFLSPFGLRSLSKHHEKQPFVLRQGGETLRVAYEPGESTSSLFGGNSNWRGPVWFPVNFLLIEALERYHHFHGDSFKVECPTGSGHLMTLKEVSLELRRRLIRLFRADEQGRRSSLGDQAPALTDPAWRDLILFHEYFHAETGRGLGASHQTGWTALVANCLSELARGEAELG